MDFDKHYIYNLLSNVQKKIISNPIIVYFNHTLNFAISEATPEAVSLFTLAISVTS